MIDENRTAAMLLDRTDSILDIAKVLKSSFEGLDDICQIPARDPRNPADI
jgi:hypothetical protein